MRYDQYLIFYWAVLFKRLKFFSWALLVFYLISRDYRTALFLDYLLLWFVAFISSNSISSTWQTRFARYIHWVTYNNWVANSAEIFFHGLSIKILAVDLEHENCWGVIVYSRSFHYRRRYLVWCVTAFWHCDLYMVTVYKRRPWQNCLLF